MAKFANRAPRGAGLEPATEGAAPKREPGMDDGSELREPVSSGAKPASGKPEGALGSLFSHWSEDLAAGTKQQELEEMWRTTKQQQDFVDEEAAPSEKTSKDAPRKSAPAETKTDEKEASKEDRPSS